MALKAAFPSMASTKEMKFYSPNPVSPEEDPVCEENFQLRLSDDEDCHNAEDGDISLSSISKETEDEILNKFKFDESKDEEKSENAKNESSTDKDAKIDTEKSASEPVEERKKESVIAEGEKETKDGGDEAIEKLEEIVTQKEEKIDDVKENADVESKKEDENEKKEETTVSSTEEVENEKAEDNKEKSEEDVQNEIFKRQTNDTENLLDILDVKSADENSLLQELKDPSSSSENSEKDENEEECEDIDNDKTEFDEKMDEENEEREVDETMDSIDIEENVLVQEDVQKVVEKTDNDESDQVREKDRETTEKQVKSDEKITISPLPPSPPTPTMDDIITDSKKSTDANEETSETNPTIETNEDSTKTKENESSSKSVKRSLPETSSEFEMETGSKRIKMLEKQDYYDKPKPTEVTAPPKNDDKLTDKVKTLNCLVEFMKSNVLTKLNRDNLEKLCLQKMCEAVMDKSEIGELRHQLKVQEQMIEHWRKEVTQLTKQARDLETVNTRLMTDFRSRNERDKPIMPLKITRSVGLQVNPDNFIFTARRKVVRNIPITQAGVTVPSSTSPNKQTVVHTVALTNGIVESVTTQTATAVTEMVTDSSTSATTSSFIDLTDEDDKKASSASNKRKSSLSNNNSSSTSATSATPTATAVVTSTTANKSFRIVSPSGMTVSGAPRLMYVVNSGNPVQGIIATTTPPATASKTTAASLLKVNTNGLVGQTASQRSSSAVSRSQQPSKPVQTVRPTNTPKSFSKGNGGARHPAPLPPPPISQVSIASRKPLPPRPHLQIRKNGNAIVLSWKMPYNLANYENIASYQLYAYQETSAPPSTDMWRKVGDIKALALPMACTLTQFADGNKYHFAVRAVDVLKRVGPFSAPGPILL